MIILEPGIEYYVLDVKYLAKAHVFGQLDPSWWQKFCGGEVSLKDMGNFEVGLEVYSPASVLAQALSVS